MLQAVVSSESVRVKKSLVVIYCQYDLPTELLREKSIEIKLRPADMMSMPNFDYDSIVVTTIKLQRKK